MYFFANKGHSSFSSYCQSIILFTGIEFHILCAFAFFIWENSRNWLYIFNSKPIQVDSVQQLFYYIHRKKLNIAKAGIIKSQSISGKLINFHNKRTFLPLAATHCIHLCHNPLMIQCGALFNNSKHVHWRSIVSAFKHSLFFDNKIIFNLYQLKLPAEGKKIFWMADGTTSRGLRRIHLIFDNTNWK